MVTWKSCPCSSKLCGPPPPVLWSLLVHRPEPSPGREADEEPWTGAGSRWSHGLSSALNCSHSHNTHGFLQASWECTWLPPGILGTVAVRGQTMVPKPMCFKFDLNYDLDVTHESWWLKVGPSCHFSIPVAGGQTVPIGGRYLVGRILDEWFSPAELFWYSWLR